MTRTHAVKVLLALAHLLLVVCGAARLVPGRFGSLAQRGLRLYGECSGAANGYGFFPPSVASAWDVQFSIYAEGDGWVEGAVPQRNREVRLRVGTVLGALAEEPLREAVTASLAAQ